jgi:hypothetical protein
MLRPDGTILDCGISAAAMGDLIGNKSGSLEKRNSQFADLRDRIEQIASEFDRNATLQVRIFSKLICRPKQRSGGKLY